MTESNDALRNQITRTRADLGDTVTELAARTDVKARTRQAVSETRDHAKQAVSETRDHAKQAVRQAAESASMRTGWAAGSTASSARSLLDRLGRNPAPIAVGGAAGALAGLGLYALLRRRLPLRSMALLRPLARGRQR